MKTSEENTRELWNNNKHTNIHKKELKEREKGPKKISKEIMAENLPNMGK